MPFLSPLSSEPNPASAIAISAAPAFARVAAVTPNRIAGLLSRQL